MCIALLLRQVFYSKNKSLIGRKVHSFQTLTNTFTSPSLHVPNFTFNAAVMRDVHKNLSEKSTRLKKSTETFKVEEVTNIIVEFNHDVLANALSFAGVNVLTLPPSDSPDSLFIEDTMITADSTAMITRSIVLQRFQEVDSVRDLLRKSSLQIIETQGGVIDGGDVLFTGREIFVGITSRTNIIGAESLTLAFPSYRVTAIDLRRFVMGESSADYSPLLHLKCACSMGGEDHILVGGREGSVIRSVIEAVSPNMYSFTYLPERDAANCIYVNGHLIRPMDTEISDESNKILDKVAGIPVAVPTTEIWKLDGNISSQCVLFSNLAIDGKVL